MTTAMLSPLICSIADPKPRSRLSGGIVVGLDGSPESIAALNSAAAIGAAHEWPVHIVSVLPPFASYHVGPAIDESPSEVDSLRINLREVAIRDIFEKADPDNDWTHEVVIGRPARVIVDIAESRGADLVVVGRSRHGTLDRMLGGETSLQIIRMSSKPVLAVETDLDGPRTVVAAVNFSAASIGAARIALEVMTAGGQLYLVYVDPPIEVLPAGFPLPGESRYPGDVVLWFRRLIGELDLPAGITVEPVVLSGKPVAAIVEFAQRIGADVLVAGCHGHARMERFLLGSVSTGLVRNSPCAVLVAPPCE